MLNKVKSLFSQSFFYSLGNLFAKASGLITLPLYSIYTSKEEIGLLALYETTYMFVLAIAGAGSKSGFARYYNEMPNEQEKKSLFFTTYLFNVVSSLLAVGLITMLIYNLRLFQQANYTRVILLFSLSSLLKLLFDVPIVLLRLQQKASKQVVYQVINVVLTVTGTLIALKYLSKGFEGIFWAQMVANGLTLIIMIPLIFANINWKLNLKELKDMLGYGYPLALSNVLTLVLTISDRYILEAYYSLETVGSFSVAVRVANLLQFLVIGSFYTSYYYQYYKNISISEDTRYHEKIFTYFILLIIASGLVISLYGREIIYIIMAGKTEYFDAIPVIPILVFGLLFSAMRQIFIMPLTKVKKTKLISKVLVVSGVINLVLNFIFIPHFGKEGAALTTAISQLFAALLFLRSVYAVDKIRYEWKKVSFIVFSGLLMYMVFLLIPIYQWYINIIIKGFVVLGFFLLLLAFGVFEKEEIASAKLIYYKWKGRLSKSNIQRLKNN